ncbi:serine/threonine-protein kinase [Clostridium lacusfryxellense]|uniref:serine/threonine-protein kinase n=1 Tax=Clostridium lacusfryxellense TaxID=205328 RepID=UPI001C0AD273|nr:serine/threonine-protein kinase [Clostridium lacusfryxellense]MBU3112352.1 serine/threonine protein kinase [Clostridium lacusfryxellense]
MTKIGTIIDGKYELLKKIGQGGMSVVYLAMDNRLNKQWAIKEVRKDGVKDFEIVKQGLMVETNMLKKFSHHNLPRIVDIIDVDGNFYIVMDYIEGQPLATMLNEYGAQPQEYVIEWAKQLCDVLEYLHTRNPPIIYRDMKPANVMLKPDGDLILIDFGIAREYHKQNLADTTCLGTQGYAAPEQFGGQGQTDQRTDIYCLGATLYHLVTGHNPCEPPYEIYPIRQWNQSLSTGLEKIILKCTERNPDDRYQSCAELMYAFEHYDEIDDTYKRKQVKKLITFSISSFLCIIGMVVFLFGYYGIINKRMSDYNSRINDAITSVADSVAKGEFTKDAVDKYNLAIDIDPSKKDAYIKLLDYYTRMGQTKNGLDTLTSMIASNDGGLKKNNDVLMYVARLFFNGNPNDSSFDVDYESAAKYFGMVDDKVLPEATYYKSISVSLSEFSARVDWKSVLNNLKKFEVYNDSQNIDNTQIENYLSLSSVYIANKSYIRQVEADPFTAAIKVIGKAQKSVEFLKDQNTTNVYQTDIMRRLGDAYYLKAAFNDSNKIQANLDYDIAIAKYLELIPIITKEDTKIKLEQLIAEMYKAKGDFATAAINFESLILKYPTYSGSYSSFGLMALIDMNNKAKAVELYNKANAFPSSKNDFNFKSLEQKLKNAGAI